MITATKNEKKLVIDTLTSAFLDNKSINYIVPQDGLKLYRIHKLMDYSFEICMLFGKVYISDDRKGCALILYPELKKTTLKTILLDFQLIFNCIGFKNLLKTMQRESKINSIKPKVRMAYVWFIGVDPKYQKFGLGKKLMKEIIISTMQDHRPIFLETSTLENLPWYKKFGFKIYDQLILDYTMYFLKRPV
jgi:GNAT superfamily N-acetyltransferase